MSRPRDIHEAVDALIARERVGEPSVWEQLEASVAYATGSGSAGSFTSRPPIATGVVSLIIEITQAAVQAAVEHVGESRRSTPGNLLAIAATITDNDEVAWWTDAVSTWTAKARSALGLTVALPRSVRGVCCITCGAHIAREDEDNTIVPVPALAILWKCIDDSRPDDKESWLIRSLECRACGQEYWRDGKEYNRLIEQVHLVDALLKYNREQEVLGL